MTPYQHGNQIKRQIETALEQSGLVAIIDRSRPALVTLTRQDIVEISYDIDARAAPTYDRLTIMLDDQPDRTCWQVKLEHILDHLSISTGPAYGEDGLATILAEIARQQR